MLQRLSFPLLLKPLIPNTSLSLLHVGMSKNYLNKGGKIIHKSCVDERLKEEMKVWDGETNSSKGKDLHVALKI